MASKAGPSRASVAILASLANQAAWSAAARERDSGLAWVEANSRTAALLSGQVDWIDAPSPDAMGMIQSRGHKVYFDQQRHVWPWQLSLAEGSPWLDKRVRQAANLSVDRLGIMKLLGGMMSPPKGTVVPGHPWCGNSKFDIKYDLAAGQKLMTEAGHSAAKPLKVKVQISASG